MNFIGFIKSNLFHKFSCFASSGILFTAISLIKISPAYPINLTFFTETDIGETTGSFSVDLDEAEITISEDTGTIGISGLSSVTASTTLFDGVTDPDLSTDDLTAIENDLSTDLTISTAAQAIVQGALEKPGDSVILITPTRSFEITVVPEPLTVIGSVTALGFGAYFKKEYSRKQKKEKAKA